MGITKVKLDIPAKESTQVDFKDAECDAARIAEAACAFLNCEGGTVFVGVDENGMIMGVDDPDAMVDTLRSELQDRISPKGLWSVGVEEYRGQRLVTVEVSAGHERPYVCDGKIFVRKSTREVAATAEEIHQMIEVRHRTPFRWEREPATAMTFHDLDSKELFLTMDDFRQTGRFDIANDSESTDILCELGLLNSGVISNACAFLFGQKPARNLPQTRVRATVFATDKGGSDFVDNRVFEGHAFSLLYQLEDFLRRNMRTVSEFEPEQMQRTDRPEYPFMALREGLMNALTHRDYSAFDGGMSVGVYPHRIEIWNSGALPDGLTVSKLKKRHPSLPRNPDIAHTFYLRGLIERIGRGTIKILDDCRAANLPTPVWLVDELGVTLTLFGRQAKLDIKLNKRQLNLLARLDPGASLSPGDYYEMEKSVSQRQAQRDLSSLEAGGWLRQEGDGPATTYIRTSQSAR
ncbi:MAG: RNA-binding domain-containing protein [Planctomycetota bacterium]